MNEFRDQALEKLRKEAAAVSGSKERAIVQGGSFPDCMKAVAKGVGASISDLEAYRKAVQFYFPGAEIRMQMTIDLIGAAAESSPETKEPEQKKPENIVLDFTEFL